MANKNNYEVQPEEAWQSLPLALEFSSLSS